MTRPDHDNTSFDQWLDDVVRGESTPGDDVASDDTTAGTGQLRAAARQIHDLAAQSDRLVDDVSVTGNRLDRIWEQVMMNTGAIAAGGSAGVRAGAAVSGSTRSGRTVPLFARHRWQGIVNTVVAAALILGLTVGVWLTYQGMNGGGGGSENEPVHFSAISQNNIGDTATPEVVNQDGTPIAAPVIENVDMPTAEECVVEPLTVDQVLAAVDNAYIGEQADSPDAYAGSGAENVSSSHEGPPPETVLIEVSALQREWSACVLAGSWMQLFALMDKPKIRWIVTERLYPTYLSREDGRAIIETLETSGVGPHGETAEYVFGSDRIGLVNPDPTLSKMVGRGYVAPAILMFDSNGALTQVIDSPGVNEYRYFTYVWDSQDKAWRMLDFPSYLG
jgi:hypothetical protein